MDKQERTLMLIKKMTELGISNVVEKDLVDFDIQGDETDEKLAEYARNWASEEHTERCAAKDAWKYEN